MRSPTIRVSSGVIRGSILNTGDSVSVLEPPEIAETLGELVAVDGKISRAGTWGQSG